MTEARNNTAKNWKHARESLGHIFWIGGVTTAGKSTIAKMLADDFGMSYYSGDSRLVEHLSRATKKEYPALYAVNTEQIMVSLRSVLLKPPDKIREMMRDIYRESLRMIVEDLLTTIERSSSTCFAGIP